MRSEYWSEEVGVEDEFAKEREGVRQRCGDCTPITNTGQLRVEVLSENTEERETLKEGIAKQSVTDPVF